MAFTGTQINPKRFGKSQIKFYIILIPLAIIFLLPVVYIISQAFKPLDELFYFPPKILVEKPTTKNFVDLLRAAGRTGVPMSRYLFNSIIVTVLSIVLTLFITVATAYCLSKKDFKAKKTLNSINQLALMFVGTAVGIPRYLVIVHLGLSDSFLAHIIPYLAMPVGLFLVKQFMDQVPNELIEAAKVDGATDFHILLHIIIPQVKPALATVAILVFQQVWNATEASTTYIIDETKKSFAFYLNTLTSSTTGPAGQGMSAAAGLIMFLPNVIIFILMQSQVMDTMAHSGIK